MASATSPSIATARPRSSRRWWTGLRPSPPDRRNRPAVAAPAVAVPAAYVAAQEYGQRLAHSLHAFEQQEDAENKQLLWDSTVGLVGFLPGWWGVGAGLVEGYAAIALGMDGTFEVGADRGLHFDAGDAADLAAEGAADGPCRATRRSWWRKRGRRTTAPCARSAPSRCRNRRTTTTPNPLVDTIGGAAAERITKFLPRPR